MGWGEISTSMGWDGMRFCKFGMGWDEILDEKLSIFYGILWDDPIRHPYQRTYASPKPAIEIIVNKKEPKSQDQGEKAQIKEEWSLPHHSNFFYRVNSSDKHLFANIFFSTQLLKKIFCASKISKFWGAPTLPPPILPLTNVGDYPKISKFSKRKKSFSEVELKKKCLRKDACQMN
jgi:hypothetical protein